MEKSFLNFKVRISHWSFMLTPPPTNALQAANPDWNPSDPSGSIYLNRMADFTSTHPRHSPSYGRRRAPGVTTILTMPEGPEVPPPGDFGERKQDMSLIDRTTVYTYDRALRQSQHAATTRRRHPGGGGGGSIPGGRDTGSMLLAPGGMKASSLMYQSGVGAMALAQTAVLGDSQGSEALLGTDTGAESREGIVEDDLAQDGAVGSGLGESYVDGGRKQHAGDEDDEELEDGGVVGLLAQIYGGRGGLRA